MNDVAKNIKKIRTESGMTQEDLAEKMFVTRQTISNWETGKSQPDIETLTELAEVFSVTVDDLISYEKNDEENMGYGIPPKGKHIFGMVRVGEKGQIVIPAKARKIFDIGPGDNLIVLGEEGQGIALIKEKSLLGLINRAKKV